MRNYGILISATVFFLIGLGLGVVINDLPYVTMVRSVRLGELLSMSILLIATFVVPYTIKKSIDSRKLIQGVVVENIKEILNIAGSIMTIVADTAVHNEPSPAANRKRRALTRELDIRVELVHDQ